MGEMGASVLTENAARPLETFAAIMREMDSLIGTCSATGGATARSSFRTLRGRHSPDAEPLEGRAALGYTLVGRAWARRSGRTTAGDGRVHRRPPGTLRGRADMRRAADRPVEGEGQ